MDAKTSLTSLTKSRPQRSTLRHSSAAPSRKFLSFFKQPSSKKDSIETYTKSHPNSAESLIVAINKASGVGGTDASSLGAEWDVEKPRKGELWVDGNYTQPYVEMPNEVNFLGGLGPNVGHPRSNMHIMRPTTIQKIYNMRTGNHAVFTFCEDPKKANNVVQKQEKIDYRNVKRMQTCVERVRLTQNVETPPPSDFSEDPTEIFDDENPLNLDFQGLDHQQTYQRDEQELQNRREYFAQKRHLDKKRMIEKTVTQFKIEERQRDFGLPDLLNVDVVVPGDEDLQAESIPPPVLPWTDKYRLQTFDYEPKFRRPVPDAIPYAPPPAILAKLTRTVNKAENRAKDQVRTELCQEKLNEMQRSKRRKEEIKKTIELDATAIQKERDVFDIAETDFNRHFINEFQDLEKSFANLPSIYHEQKFPHTLRETKFVHRKMNRTKRTIRDEAIIRNEFNNTNAPENPLTKVVPVDEQSIDASELSEQSTDDEDGMSVGQKSDAKYQLRGFHYKLGDELRGLFDVKPKSKWDRVPRSCITRKQWFDQMAQVRREHTLFNKKNGSLPNRALPNDPNYILFEPEQVPPKVISVAPVKDMIENAGDEPRILNAKQPKLKKPEYCKVKKFNLTAYIFGSQPKIKAKKSIAKHGATENKYGVSYDMIQKCDTMFKKTKDQNKAMRLNRMRALGIPIAQQTKSILEEDKNSDISENSDWVPAKPRSKSSANLFTYSASMVPEFREPTSQLRSMEQHWKDGTQNSQNTNLSKLITDNPQGVSRSELGGQTYNVPRLSKLASDIILPPNLSVKRTEYTDLFQSRHHHPHRDQTQHKSVHVKYLPKLPKFQPPLCKKERVAKTKPFQRSNYRQGKPLQEDLALPKLEIKEQEITPKELDITLTTSHKVATLKTPSTSAFRSRTEVEETPNKSAFRRLLFDRNEIAVLETNYDKQTKLSVDPDQFVERLKQEAESIKLCDSSNASTVCSNYTNDSESFIDLEGVKIPCRFITKSQVPFEEIDRSRVFAEAVDKNDEYFGPYYAVPFAGQKMDMRQLSLPKDKFFTSAVRSRYGIRNRLSVKVPGFSNDHIGIKDCKRISQLATEWDSYYQNEIVTRPRIRKFKPRTIIAQARDALRKKFVSDYIQEALIEKAVVAEKERKYAEEVLEFEKKINPLFTQWEEKHYRKYMRKMQDVKPYYDLTAKLKNDLAMARDKFIRIEMSIIYMEDDWRRRTIMQNFHYMLGDPAWRIANDWIHRKEDGSLENFQESILKRPFTNVRNRDKDSAWAVKEFYENFFKNKIASNVHIVFKDATEFLNGLNKIKLKTFVCLLELHFAMWTLANLQHGYNTFTDWSRNYIERRKKFVKTRCAKKYFNEDMAANLQRNAVELVTVNLQQAVSAPKLRILMALCETLFEKIVPKQVRDNIKSGAPIIDKFTMIVNMVMSLLEQLDQVPHDIRVKAERRVRINRAFVSRQSKRTLDLDTRIKRTAIQMRKNLAPAYVRVPQTHPLPRSVVVKKVVNKVAPKVQITEVEKLFYKAFTDDTTSLHMEIDQSSGDKAAILKSLEANCIPFYFDVFLRQNQYFPTYDFQTEIEKREGSEYKQFKYDDVLENVQTNLQIWELNKQAIMDENIRQTWQLYASRTNV